MSLSLPLPPSTRTSGPYVSGAGQTAFSVTFPFLRGEDLRVEIRPGSTGAWSVATPGIDYAVTGAGVPGGGSVAFYVGRPAGSQVRIVGAAAIASEVDAVPAGSFSSQTWNEFANRVTVWAQEARRDIDGLTGSVDTALDELSTQAETLVDQQAAINAHASAIAAHASALSVLQASDAAQAGSLDALSGRVSGLEASDAGQASALTGLDSRMSTQEAQVAGIQAAIEDGALSGVPALDITWQELPTRVPLVRVWRTSGHAVPGDLGEGMVMVLGTSAGPMARQDADGRWWQMAPAGRPVSAGWFGAKGDGVVSDHAALQAWLTYIGANGLVGYLPKGRFRKPNNTPSLTLSGDIRIVGDGMFSSVIYHDDTVQLTRNDLFLGSSIIGSIHLDGVGFEGTWGVGGDWSQRSPLAGFQPTGGTAKIINCSFRNSSFLSLTIVGARQVEVSGCVLDKGVADGIRIIDCGIVVVEKNCLSAINDDAIAVHTLDSAGFPAKQNIIITNNTLIDCQGIRVLGAKTAKISDNTLIRCQGHAIAVQCGSIGSTEGVTALLNVAVTDNIIIDMFNARRFSAASADFIGWIVLGGTAPTANPAGFYVFEPDGAGGIVAPYPYFYENNVDGVGGTQLGAFGFTVSDNICVRTLAPTSAYSNYGYGQRYSRTGPVDPSIRAQDIIGTQVYVLGGSLRNSIISDNVLWGGALGIHLNGSAANPYIAYANLAVRGNYVGNQTGGCFYALGRGTVNLDGNTFDGDPLHVHAGRLPNGKWTSGSTFPGVWTDTVRVIATRNTFRNLYSVYLGSGASQQVWSDNIIACNPSGIGYNADNIGIGDIYIPEFYGTLLVEDGDPASATYGRVLNTCVRAATAMPTSGKYGPGHFTKNLFPAISGGKVLRGWTRLTLGSGHVLDVDWARDYAPTS
ncbi:right-handed parallel beta-helix repeat-containing protein [Xanthobacter sp. V3C-3]|uniref:right-handed parallel beta-helix repeat-containing protein n=1 Tax=Xanthobacter lutulentifluminis TaxID=3119935 RepID=UPI00372CDF9F